VESILQKAQEVGRQISQSDEYKALKRADERLSGDREAVQLLNRLNSLEGELTAMMRAGQEPSVEQQEEYQALVEKLQQLSAYQGMVAAQSNFDRLMVRINEEIARGIEAGEKSRIILT